MNHWLIEPRDPLIARDGRPAGTGGSLSTLGFPYPSVLAGAVRTRLGSTSGSFQLNGVDLEELKRIEVHGPLLAELAGASDDVAGWLPPAPRDALILEGSGKGCVLKRLVPRSLTAGRAVDALEDAGLLPILPAGSAHDGKAARGAPPFWHWDELERWLTAPADRDHLDLGSLGVAALPVEARSHLAIQPGERVGIDGMLFQTSGLRFLQDDRSGKRLAPRRLALSVRCGGGMVGGKSLALRNQLAPLGGERRLARWRESAANWPGLPAAILERVVATRRARLVLLTPAVFAAGAIPGWSGQPSPWGGSARASVRAACVPRPEIVSGWDLAIDNGPGKPKGRPKPTRRLAAAGSVYFVELQGGGTDDLRHWCESAWLSCLSDADQDRQDGFGLAVVGTWEEPR